MRILATTWQDVRYAVRAVRRAPVFAAAATLTLALGIGANAALFTVTRGVLLETLPVEQPERLVDIGCINPNNPEDACRTHYPGYLMYRAHTDVLSGVVAFAPAGELAANVDGRAEIVAGLLVSGNTYSVLGLNAHEGRLLVPADDRTDAPLVAVLSHDFWRRRFGGDASVIGRTIRLGNQTVTVVGVTPPAFRGLSFGAAPDVTLPIAAAEIFRQPGSLEARAAWWVHVMGRLQPGMTAARAHAALEPTFRATMRVTLEALPPEAAAGVRDFIESFRFRLAPAAGGGISDFRRSLERPLLILWGVVGLVLLITCVNLAGLMLSRAVDRRREVGVRLALGAGRLRITRQALAEPLVLAVAGGAIGLGIAQWATPLAVALGLGEVGLRAVDLRPDAAILTFTAAISIATGLAMGVATVWHLSRTDPVEAWRAAPAGGRAPFGRTLVAAQIAISMVLLVAAALFVRSLANAREVDSGFDHARVITVTVAPAMAGYEPEAAVGYLQQVVAAVEGVAGVRSATYNAVPIATGLVSQTSVSVPGIDAAAGEIATGQNRVGPRFAETLGLRLVGGRDLRAGDESGRVALVNERFARFFFKTTDVIGRTFVLGNTTPAYSIVGVVSDAHDRSIVRPIENWVYIPLQPDPAPRVRLSIRTGDDIAAVLPAVERAIQGVDAGVPVYGVRTLAAQIEDTLRRERLLAGLGAAFGGLALVLAAIGAYAMFNTMVSRRTREIGVRMAVGATGRRIAVLLGRDAGVVALAGLAAGAAGGAAAAHVIRNQLFGVDPTDPRWMAAAAAILLLTTVAAIWHPARRAIAVDPAATLRSE